MFKRRPAVPPSSCLPLHLSLSLSLWLESLCSTVAINSTSTPPPGSKEPFLYRKDRNMHCKKPPSNRHHHLLGLPFYLSLSFFVFLHKLIIQLVLWYFIGEQTSVLHLFALCFTMYIVFFISTPRQMCSTNCCAQQYGTVLQLTGQSPQLSFVFLLL